MFRVAVVVISILFAVGCDGLKSDSYKSKADAKEAIYKVLKDPDSAKFGDFTMEVSGSISLACFTVNAKNSYGGYVGDRVFSLFRQFDEPWEVISSKDKSHMSCVSTNKKIAGSFPSISND